MAWNTDRWYEDCQRSFARQEKISEDWKLNGNPYERNHERQYYEDMHGVNKNSGRPSKWIVPTCEAGLNRWYWDHLDYWNKGENWDELLAHPKETTDDL